jgi:hypothetical protein
VELDVDDDEELDELSVLEELEDELSVLEDVDELVRLVRELEELEDELSVLEDVDELVRLVRELEEELVLDEVVLDRVDPDPSVEKHTVLLCWLTELPSLPRPRRTAVEQTWSPASAFLGTRSWCVAMPSLAGRASS